MMHGMMMGDDGGMMMKHGPGMMMHGGGPSNMMGTWNR